jgi:hypothetical protein
MKSKSDKSPEQKDKNTANNDSQNEKSIDSTMDNLGMVRDLLFGAYKQDVDKRLDTIEKQCNGAIGEMREEMQNFFSSLKEYITTEVGVLQQKINNERSKREEEQTNVTNNLATLKKTVESKDASLRETVATMERDLQQHLFDKINGVTSEIRQKHTSINALLKEEIASVRNDKVSRSFLASLFAEKALQLSDGQVNASPSSNEISVEENEEVGS